MKLFGVARLALQVSQSGEVEVLASMFLVAGRAGEFVVFRVTAIVDELRQLQQKWLTVFVG